MAVIWCINHTMSDDAAAAIYRADSYTQNKDKTTIKEDEISRTMEYANRLEKTRAKVRDAEAKFIDEELAQSNSGAKLVTALNCSESTVVKDFMQVKSRFAKTDGVAVFHLVQSFPKDITDPRLIHQIGIEFAKATFGKKFQCTVATHTDKDHLHNHFVINSVSFVDGKKFHLGRKDYYELRAKSDELSLQHNLPVISEPGKGGRNKTDHAWKKIIKDDVDNAIDTAKSYYEFFDILKAKGYIFRGGNLKDISLRPVGRERNFRLAKNLGENYTPEAIKKRIYSSEKRKSTYKPKDPKDFATIYRNQVRRFVGASYRLHVPVSRKSFKALRYEFSGLFLKSSLLLGLHRANGSFTVPKNAESYINGISEETRFIAEHKFKTLSEMSKYKEQLKGELQELTKEKKNLSRQKNPDVQKITENDTQKAAKKKELAIIERIERRSKNVAAAETYNQTDEKQINSANKKQRS